MCAHYTCVVTQHPYIHSLRIQPAFQSSLGLHFCHYFSKQISGYLFINQSAITQIVCHTPICPHMVCQYTSLHTLICQHTCLQQVQVCTYIICQRSLQYLCLSVWQPGQYSSLYIQLVCLHIYHNN